MHTDRKELNVVKLNPFQITAIGCDSFSWIQMDSNICMSVLFYNYINFP